MNGTVLDGRVVMEDWLKRGMPEVPDGSNCNDISHEYGFCAAWCCMTWSVMLKHIGLNTDWQAAVGAAINDAKAGKNGLIWIPRNGVIREGDAATFDWGGKGNWNDFHIAAWVRDPGTQAKFLTIAGNENNRVMEQWRDRTYVQGFIRPPFRSAPTPAPTPTPPQEDDSMGIRLISYKGGSSDPSRAAQYVILDGILLPLEDGLDVADLEAKGGTYTEVDQPLYDAIAEKAAS